jgi:hypothetical protein
MPRGLRGIRSLAVYYGKGAEQVLSSFELVVVHPDNLKREAVEYLRSKGTRVLAYVSALEIPRDPQNPVPVSSLRVGGVPLVQSEFNNWILDPRHERVRARLYGLGEQIADIGFDGIFLDTIGDVEDRRIPPDLRAVLAPAAAHLVAGLSEEVGVGSIVQNWGLYDLLPLTAPYLDGVCWENFPYAKIGPLPALHSGVRRLHMLQEQYGFIVFALNEGLPVGRDRDIAMAAAARCDFVWYGTEDYTLLPVEVGN